MTVRGYRADKIAPDSLFVIVEARYWNVTKKEAANVEPLFLVYSIF